MTGMTRAELERRLVRHLTEEGDQIMATTDIQRQHELLESRLQQDRRRRRTLHVAALAAAAAAAAAAVIAGVLVGSGAGSGHKAAPAAPAAALPRPAGSALTVYSGVGSTPGSVVHVLSFLDTRGRWCVATLDSSAAPTPTDYDCRSAKLPATGHGFGAVYGNQDAPTYDNYRSWFGGVATPDVKSVDLVFPKGQIVHATVRDQGSAHGIVFSVAYPTVTFPVYYRAYGADGHLIQQLPIQQPVIPSG